MTPFEETSNPLIVDSTENRNFMAVKLPHIKACKRSSKEMCHVICVKDIVSKCMFVELSDTEQKFVVFVEEFPNKTECD